MGKTYTLDCSEIDGYPLKMREAAVRSIFEMIVEEHEFASFVDGEARDYCLTVAREGGELTFEVE